MVCTQEYVIKWLKEHLSEERYEHSIGAAEYAKELALKYGLDAEKAYFTGLIHDCAKCLSKEETNQIIEQFVEIDEEEFCSPKTHHAPVGSYIAQKEFGVVDQEILSAIRWHTVGKKDMSLFEKIIFLADKLERRTREAEIREPLEQELNNGIDSALLLCYKNTIKSLVVRNLRICTSTIDIYNTLLNNIK